MIFLQHLWLCLKFIPIISRLYREDVGTYYQNRKIKNLAYLCFVIC